MLLPPRIRRLGALSEELHGSLRCVLLLIGVLALGTSGFMLIEPDWGLWQSLFFTLITITTVGYGDEGVSPQGEVFAAVMLLLGIGTATYTFSSLVQLAVTYQSSWKRRMEPHLCRLQNHFIISGFGRIGRTVAQQLEEAKLPFVIIDNDKEVVEDAMEKGYLVIEGNAAEDDTLCEARISRARGIISATNSDAENVFVVLSARELNPHLFIAARASTESAAHKLRRAGATLVVSPYVSAGHQITDAILRPKMAEFLLRSRHCRDLQLSELVITKDSPFCGKTICEVGEQFPDVVFVLIQSEGESKAARPRGNRQLKHNDELIVAGTHRDLETLFDASECAPA